jgi:prevent-host-death family protein
MITVSLTEARRTLGQLIDQVVATGEHVTITRRGRPVAVIVPYAWHEARVRRAVELYELHRTITDRVRLATAVDALIPLSELESQVAIESQEVDESQSPDQP